MRLTLLIIGILINFAVKAEHPLHMSVVNMNLEADSMKITYSVRLFQEDLIVLIGMLSHEALHKNQVLDSNAVHNYMNQALKIQVGQKYITPILLHKKSSELEYWLYYEIKLKHLPSELTIQNKIFLELFADQQNLVIFSFNNKEKGLTFDAQNQKQPISLNSI